MDYAVVGQQKSGTSTLWNQMRANPNIAWVGANKEPLYFNGDWDYPRNTLCDNDLERYQVLVGTMRKAYGRLDLRVGDWSATYFSCICCPTVLRTINPNIKVLVILRDPVQRSLSRFLEQKLVRSLPHHKQVANHTFASYVAQEVAAVEGCVARAGLYRQRQQEQGPGSGGSPRGWGAGMDLGAWMEAQCYERSNILGWSVYDVFLENYLAHFPQKQVMVVYTEELAADPLSVIRKIEAYLEVPPATYDPKTLSTVFNSRGCYSWTCARRSGTAKTARRWRRTPGMVGNASRDASGAAAAAAQQRRRTQTQGHAEAAAAAVAAAAAQSLQQSLTGTVSPSPPPAAVQAAAQTAVQAAVPPPKQAAAQQVTTAEPNAAWLAQAHLRAQPSGLTQAGQQQQQAQALLAMAQAQAAAAAEVEARQAEQAQQSQQEWRAASAAAQQAAAEGWERAVARLTAFYRPHMQRLFRWADEGRIAQVPPAWRQAYA